MKKHAPKPRSMNYYGLMADGKLITILLFAAINFSILFIVKSRTAAVIGLITSHLAAIIFFSLSIANYNIFEEITLALIVYSMTTLFLISNHNQLHLGDEENTQTKNSKSSKIFVFAFLISFLAVFLAFFLIIKKLPEISQNSAPELLFWSEEKLAETNFTQNSSRLENDELFLKRKKARLRNKLSDNFLLKRSSDVILISAFLIAMSLILSSKKQHN